jgi:hypothetical protein
VQRVGAQDFEAQGAVVIRHPIKGAAIGVGDGLGGDQDGFEQSIDVALFGKRSTNRIKLFKAAKQVAGGIHARLPT